MLVDNRGNVRDAVFWGSWTPGTNLFNFPTQVINGINVPWNGSGINQGGNSTFLVREGIIDIDDAQFWNFNPSYPASIGMANPQLQSPFELTYFAWRPPSQPAYYPREFITITPINQDTTYLVKEVVNGISGPILTQTTWVLRHPGTPSSIRTNYDSLGMGARAVVYEVDPIPYATSYQWTVPQGVNIISGVGTNRIVVNYPSNQQVVGSFGVNGDNPNVPTPCGPAPRSTLDVRSSNFPYAGNINFVAPDTIGLFDELCIDLEIQNGVDIFSAFGKLHFDTTWLRIEGYLEGGYLGSQILSQPPIVSGPIIDFGVTKISGASGQNGNGLWYRFCFSVKPDLPRTDTQVLFRLEEITFFDSAGSPIYLNNTSDSVMIAYPVLVWPGDLNNDKKVDVTDILPIGYFYGEKGPPRPNATVAWTAQEATLWGYKNIYPNGSAYKVFADATGDGEIDLADQAPIGINLNKFYNKRGDSTDYPPFIVNAGAPTLDMILSDTLLGRFLN